MTDIEEIKIIKKKKLVKEYGNIIKVYEDVPVDIEIDAK